MADNNNNNNALEIDLNLPPNEEPEYLMGNQILNLIDLIDQPPETVTQQQQQPVLEEATSENKNVLECNICWESPKEAVVTSCGHLFCWPCLYKWMNFGPNKKKECPVCKGQITDKNITPIYGGEDDVEVNCDNSNSGQEIPSRPSASRVKESRQTRQRGGRRGGGRR